MSELTNAPSDAYCTSGFSPPRMVEGDEKLGLSTPVRVGKSIGHQEGTTNPESTNRTSRHSATRFSPTVESRGFRIKEAAAYAGLSPWYVEELVRSKQLPALKLCRHYTILREDLDAFLDRKREEIAA